MAIYRFAGGQPPELQAPVLVGALEGWVDAAGAATGAAAHIARSGEVIATFDPDEIVDYRARRPWLDIVEGSLKELTWPELTVRHVRTDGRDVLVLTGPEPDYRWRAFADGVLEMALRLGVIQWISVGSIPTTVPHTRPTPLRATASRRELLRPDDVLPEGTFRVPAAAITAVEFTFREHGIPTVGFWAQAPHYVGTTYTPAVISLVERLALHLGVTFPLGDLVSEAAAQRQQLDAVLEARPEVKEYVERLEELQPGERVTGEELAEEIERFLREQRGDGGADPLGGGRGPRGPLG